MKSYPALLFNELVPQQISLSMALSSSQIPEITNVLEIGCGRGLNSMVWATSTNIHVTAIDVDPDAILYAERLKELTGFKNIEFKNSPLEQLLPTTKFDLVICHGLWTWHFDQKARAYTISFLRKWLSPKGLFAMSYNVCDGWTALMPLVRYARKLHSDREDIRQLLDPHYFSTVQETHFWAKHPKVKNYLIDSQNQPDGYFEGELLAPYFEPEFIQEVVKELSEHNLIYRGSLRSDHQIRENELSNGSGDEYHSLMKSAAVDEHTFRFDLFQNGAAENRVSSIPFKLYNKETHSVTNTYSRSLSTSERNELLALLKNGDWFTALSAFDTSRIRSLNRALALSFTFGPTSRYLISPAYASPLKVPQLLQIKFLESTVGGIDQLSTCLKNLNYQNRDNFVELYQKSISKLPATALKTLQRHQLI
ncbi:class I SAM-dependent methyltransferase [Litoricolaceae bacterium]|nr:class I SAM-dependent methyltransferase [Litorivicinaceae bacterium]